MSTIELHHGDSYQVLRKMISEGRMFDSVVCDPPYGLTSIVKRFGKDGAAPAKHSKDGSFSRLSKGFMGHTWDGTQIERDPEFWRLVLEVTKPGGYIAAFSSSRTYGHMQVAMEAAGWISHPMIGWVFATGFPKAHNAARAIDQALGVKGDVIPSGDPVRRVRPGADQVKDATWEKLSDRTYQPGTYAPVTEEAQAWEGWHYGGQVRKPALEPIFIGQRPFSEKNGALNILKHGVGAVNIDECRVPVDPEADSGQLRTMKRNALDRDDGMSTVISNEPSVTRTDGRWPANLIHDGSPEVVALFPESAGQRGSVGPAQGRRDSVNVYGDYGPRPQADPRGDSGSAARFFNVCPPDLPPFIYSAKANKADRAGSSHSTVKPISLIRELIRHLTPPGGTTIDPFAGSGTSGKAALDEGMRSVLIERESQYVADIMRRFGVEDPAIDLLIGGYPLTLHEYASFAQSEQLEEFDSLIG